MANNGSALVGMPPNNQDDYWIVRANLFAAGLTKLDPAKGAKIPPPRPPPDQYVFESKATEVIACSAVCVAIMLIVTISRLMLRRFKTRLRWGADDWFIIPGLVCVPLPLRATDKYMYYGALSDIGRLFLSSSPSPGP